MLNLFRTYAEETFKKEEFEELQGMTLICHCDPGQECHGDFLARKANEERDVRNEEEKMTYDHGDLEDGLPVRIGDPPGENACDLHPRNGAECDLHLQEDEPLDPNVWRGWLGRAPP